MRDECYTDPCSTTVVDLTDITNLGTDLRKLFLEFLQDGKVFVESVLDVRYGVKSCELRTITRVLYRAADE